MASIPWSLVTPASRGIGYALTRQLLQTTKAPVVATARGDLDGVRERLLSGLDGVQENRLKVLKLDVLDETSIADAASECKSIFPSSEQQGQKAHHLRMAFLIPGILHPEKALDQVDVDKALETFRINSIGPLLLLKHFSAFLPSKRTELLSSSSSSSQSSASPSESSGSEADGDAASGLPARSVCALMSARVGSISDNNGLGGWYSYRASKAAVSQLARTFDQELKRTAAEKAFSLALHPGTVKTGLSKGYWDSNTNLLEPEDAAARLVKVVRSVAAEKGDKGGDQGFANLRGKCLDYAGTIVPP